MSDYPTERFDMVNECDFCKADLSVGKIMSWFTYEVICIDCSEVEDYIKKNLRDNGFGDHENIGFVPNVPKMVLDKATNAFKHHAFGAIEARNPEDFFRILDWRQRRFRRKHRIMDDLIEKYNENEDADVLTILENMVCWDAEEAGLKDPRMSNAKYLEIQTKEEEDDKH